MIQESSGKDSLLALAAKGAKVVPVDYSDKAALKRALTGVDVIISMVRQEGLTTQVDMAEVAKEAGVKLFLPSEFGMPTTEKDPAFLAVKAKVLKQIQAMGLPTLSMFCGAFADTIWVGYVVVSSVDTDADD